MFEAMRRYADRTSGGGGINPKAPSAPKPRPLRHSRVGIAGWTARHVLITLAVWFAVLAGAFVLAGSLNVSSEGGVESTDARRASALIEEATGAEPPVEEFVLVEASAGPDQRGTLRVCCQFDRRRHARTSGGERGGQLSGRRGDVAHS